MVLIMSWKGIEGDQGIWFSSFDGNNWVGQQNVTGVGTSIGPSLAVFNGRLFMAWKGIEGDQGIWFSSFDGNNWAPQRHIDGVGTSFRPSLSDSPFAQPTPPSPPTNQIDINWDPIVFGGGVPVGGSSHLTIRQDGTYTFSGHFHDSGATEYNMALMIAVKDSQNRVYTFQHDGHASGTFEPGSRNDDWNNDGQKPEIAQYWGDMIAGHTWHADANADGDFTNLFNSIMGTLGTVLAVVAVVAA